MANPWRRGRALLLTAVVAALALLSVVAHPMVAAASNPNQVDGPGIITIEQVNMCLWGKQFYGPPPAGEDDRCLWQSSSGSDADELAIASTKRSSMVNQLTGHIPDVLTVSEGCQADVLAVAAAAGYQVRWFDTGSRPDADVRYHTTYAARQCSAGRGDSVNAILAKKFIDQAAQASTEPKGLFDPSLPHGYFPIQWTSSDGVVHGSYRSYLCAQVSTSEWPSVRVCTAHLSLHSTQTAARAQECAYLQDDVLDPSPGYTLFAGDVNAGSDTNKCNPSRYHGLADRDPSTAVSGTVYGLQDIYYSAGFWRQTCGWDYVVQGSDHPGYLLELGKAAPDPPVSSCARVISR